MLGKPLVHCGRWLCALVQMINLSDKCVILCVSGQKYLARQIKRKRQRQLAPLVTEYTGQTGQMGQTKQTRQTRSTDQTGRRHPRAGALGRPLGPFLSNVRLWRVTGDLHGLDIVRHVDIGEVRHSLTRRKRDLRSLEVLVLVGADRRVRAHDHALNLIVPVAAL